MSFCRSCTKPTEYIEALKQAQESWYTAAQVKEICSQCYLNMLRNNITKIKKETLINGIKKANNMLLNEITWVYSGPATSYNFYGRVLNPNQPIYLEDAELPDTIQNIEKLGIKCSKVEFDKKPNEAELQILQNRASNNFGIVWIGTSPRRTNEFGTFVRNEPRFDLTLEQVATLKDMPGFKVV